jgi:hypothetical protein
MQAMPRSPSANSIFEGAAEDTISLKDCELAFQAE